MRIVHIALVLSLLAPAAAASQLEGALAPACQAVNVPVEPAHLCQYQQDGGAHGDAPDACLASPHGFALGGSTQAMLLPLDDTVDHLTLRIPASAVGRIVNVAFELGLVPRLLGPLFPYHLDVFLPNTNCAMPADHITSRFVVRVPGDYLVRVAFDHAQGAAEGAGGAAPGGPAAQFCHDLCYGGPVDLNDLLGYSVAASAIG